MTAKLNDKLQPLQEYHFKIEIVGKEGYFREVSGLDFEEQVIDATAILLSFLPSRCLN